MIKSTDENKKLTAKKEAEVQEALAALNSRLEIIGNLVHDSVPVSKDEVYNSIDFISSQTSNSKAKYCFNLTSFSFYKFW